MVHKRTMLYGMITVLITVLSSGCGGNAVISKTPVSLVKEQYDISNGDSTPIETAAFMNQVVLSAGDIITIAFQFTPELNISQQIRPDGKISLQYIGEVTAEGKTPIDLSNELKSLLSAQLRNPELSITVESLYSNRIFVGGDVATPGVIEPYGPITALESIIQSGGFNLETASPANVVIIRYQGDYRSCYRLDMRPAIEGLPHIPFHLEPYDIVYVPQQKIIGMNRWIDNYINNMMPEILTGTLISYLLLDYFRD